MSNSFEDSARQLAELIDEHDSYVLSGHVDIDGDSLGSMLGMYYYLTRLGKKVVPLVFEPVLDRYSFLHADRVVEVFDPKRHAAVLRDADVFMMFDFSATARMPGLWDIVKESSVFKVCVDHHPAESLPGDLNIHIPDCPATGKIMLDLIRSFGGEVDSQIAEALFVAISTDTGWFRYSNTSAEVLTDAATLVEKGANANQIYRGVYQRNEVPLIRLIGRVAGALKDELGGRLLWATIPHSLVRELGVGVFETDELLDLMRTGKDAEVVVLLRELDNGKVRINLRSHGNINVSELACAVGGGGHLYAAGATMDGPLDDAASRMLKMAREAVKKSCAAESVGGSQSGRPG